MKLYITENALFLFGPFFATFARLIFCKQLSTKNVFAFTAVFNLPLFGKSPGWNLGLWCFYVKISASQSIITPGIQADCQPFVEVDSLYALHGIGTSPQHSSTHLKGPVKLCVLICTCPLLGFSACRSPPCDAHIHLNIHSGSSRSLRQLLSILLSMTSSSCAVPSFAIFDFYGGCSYSWQTDWLELADRKTGRMGLDRRPQSSIPFAGTLPREACSCATARKELDRHRTTTGQQAKTEPRRGVHRSERETLATLTTVMSGATEVKWSRVKFLTEVVDCDAVSRQQQS